MKFVSYPVRAAVLGMCVCSLACDSKEPAPGADAKNAAKVVAPSSDLPLLPLKTGDLWRFEVATENAGEAGKITRVPRVRRYVGKVAPRENLAAADCFETTTLGQPQVLEYTDISDGKMVLRGTEEVGGGGLRWLGDGVPIYRDGLRIGSKIAFSSGSGGKPGTGVSFELSLIARERLVTPAGKFDTLKLLLHARSAAGESRRSLWVSPGNGFVREENVFYADNALLMRETVVIQETNRKLRPPSADR